MEKSEDKRMKNMNELKKKMERQKLWEFFVNNKLNEATDEVIEEDKKRYGWKRHFLDTNFDDRVSKKLNKWFKDLENE